MKKLIAVVVAAIALASCEATYSESNYRDIDRIQCLRDNGKVMIHVASDRAFCDVGEDGRISMNRLGILVEPDYWLEPNYDDFDYYEYMQSILPEALK